MSMRPANTSVIHLAYESEQAVRSYRATEVRLVDQITLSREATRIIVQICLAALMRKERSKQKEDVA